MLSVQAQSGSQDLSKNRYYTMAQEAITVIKSRFPLGAINRVDTLTKLGLSEGERNLHFQTLGLWGEVADTPPNAYKLAMQANMLQPLQGGNCGIFADYAIGHLINTYPRVSIEGLYFKGHVVVLIGRKQSSNPNDFKTWGKDALIVDPWADKMYLASSLVEQRESSSNIPLYTPVLSNLNNDVVRLNVSSEHYLAGRIELIVGEACKIYDRHLALMVAMDRKNIEKPPVKTPKYTTAISAPLDAKLIKTYLSMLSKNGGWKFNSKLNAAWIECRDPAQAARIANALKAAKCCVVTESKRTDNGVPVVKCEHFNVQALKKLATPLLDFRGAMVEDLVTAPGNYQVRNY